MSELDEERLQGGLSHIATAAATGHTTHAFLSFTANVSARRNAMDGQDSAVANGDVMCGLWLIWNHVCVHCGCCCPPLSTPT